MIRIKRSLMIFLIVFLLANNTLLIIEKVNAPLINENTSEKIESSDYILKKNKNYTVGQDIVSGDYLVSSDEKKITFTFIDEEGNTQEEEGYDQGNVVIPSYVKEMMVSEQVELSKRY